MSDQGPIIFPTDFSVASLAGLEWAKRMAATTGTALHVVYVVEEPQVFRVLDLPAGPAALPTADVLISAAEQRMAAFVSAQLADAGVPVETSVLIGNPADEIVDCAERLDATMIVIGAHGYTGIRLLVLGSTTEATLRRARCPVMCVKAAD